jgi:hypothetical protein
MPASISLAPERQTVEDPDDAICLNPAADDGVSVHFIRLNYIGTKPAPAV